MIALEAEEEFDFSLSIVSIGVKNTDLLNILEVISDLWSDPFTLIDIILPTNSYLIACTYSQIFTEEGENCPFSILVVHPGLFFLILGDEITLFGLKFKFQYL